MGKIKSALEIALERTEGVKGDKNSIGLFEAKQKGKRLANNFLDDPDLSLADLIKKEPESMRDALKQGIFDTLVSQIVLPVSVDDEKRLENVGKGLSLVINNSQFVILYKQFIQLISQYLSEFEQYTEAIKQQYAPKLQQKEEEIARRIGHHIKLDPFQDPEFVAFYNQHINALKKRYQAVVDQVKEQVEHSFSGH